MKRFTKTMCMIVCGLAFLHLPVNADNGKPINVDNLPQQAQILLNSDFANKKVVLAKIENNVLNKTYEVKFTDGSSIEFDRKGIWIEIDCKHTAVPNRLVPENILKQVHERWPGIDVVKIEKDRNQYEVELSSDIEIKFDKNFKIIDID